jgi:hypothetical protein
MTQRQPQTKGETMTTNARLEHLNNTTLVAMDEMRPEIVALSKALMKRTPTNMNEAIMQGCLHYVAGLLALRANQAQELFEDV